MKKMPERVTSQKLNAGPGLYIRPIFEQRPDPGVYNESAIRELLGAVRDRVLLGWTNTAMAENALGEIVISDASDAIRWDLLGAYYRACKERSYSYVVKEYFWYALSSALPPSEGLGVEPLFGVLAYADQLNDPERIALWIDRAIQEMS